ncbi:MAG: hypothetical protein EBR53_07675 [Actinobacteria bacterium]|nr:hypothetical protein [Actinomycetota bacterium]
MYVFITLTSAGADAGPFNLYSNVDGFVSAFATGVSKAALLAGYSVVAPAGTTTVRIISNGVCTNYIDVVIGATTTTTTTSGAPTLEKMVISYGATICGSTVVWTSKTPSEVKCDWYEGYDPLVLVRGTDAYYYSNVGFVVGAQLYNSSGVPFTFTGNYVQSPNSPLANPDPFTTPPINIVTIVSGIVTAFYDISSLPACGPYVCPTTTTTTTGPL